MSLRWLCTVVLLLSSLALCADSKPNDIFIPRVAAALRVSDFVEMELRPALRASYAHVSDFIQQTPSDGHPASERTEAWFGYTKEALTIAFVCWDTQPRGLRAHLARREQITDDDYVTVLLDPFKDHRRGFQFTVNPLGVQAEALFTDDGTDPDFSYDQVWDSAGRVTEQGWIATMTIPFKSLRFRAHDAEWGVVLERNLPRRSEQDYWPRVSSQVAGVLTQEGTWSGFEGIAPSHNLQFNPYVLGHRFRALDTRDGLNPHFRHRDAQGTAGLDAKAVVNESLVIDATFNPDFSQIESDEPQQTVNQRFEVFFPEKRPFFLENSNYFRTPINLVFTRRIENPEYGVRLTGKLQRTNLGLLFAHDRGPGDTVADRDPLHGQRARFTIARASQDFGQHSSVGVLFTDREFASSFNRVGSIDTSLHLSKQWDATAQFVVSSTRSLDGKYHFGRAALAGATRQGRQFNTDLSYRGFSPDFITEAGFVRRVDRHAFATITGYRWRPEGKHIIDFGPQFAGVSALDYSGNRIYSYNELDFVFDLNHKTQISPLIGMNSDILRPKDFVGITHDTNFTQDYGGLIFKSAPIPAFSFNILGTHGGNPNYTPAPGQLPRVLDEEYVQAMVTIQPLNRLTIANTYLLDRNHSRQTGAFVYESQIMRTKLNYQFTRDFSLRSIVQYNSVLSNPAYSTLGRQKQLSTDVLFTWLPHPGTAVYVGYNSDLQNLDRTLCLRLRTGVCDPAFAGVPRSREYLNDGREFFIKASYLFRF